MLGLLPLLLLPRGAFAQEASLQGGIDSGGGGGGGGEPNANGGVGNQEPSGTTGGGGETSGAVSTGPAPVSGGGVGTPAPAPAPASGPSFSGGVNPAPAAPASSTTAFAIETPGFGGTYGYSGPGGSFVALGNAQGGPISAAQAQALADQLGVDVVGNIQGINVGLGRFILNLVRGIPVIGTFAGFASRFSPNFGPGAGAAAQGRQAGGGETGTLADVAPVNLGMPVGLTGPGANPQSQGAVNPFTPPVLPAIAGGGGGGAGGGVPGSILPTAYGSRQITTHPWYTLGLLILIIVVGYTAVTHWEQIKDWFVKVGDEVTGGR